MQLAEPDEDLLLVFDGGAIGNPGRGYGSFVYDGVVTAGPVTIEFPGRTTNNVAEYQSLIAGLLVLIEHMHAEKLDPGTTKLGVRSDSQLLVNQINGRWKVKKPHLKDLHQRVTILLASFNDYRVAWHPRLESVLLLGH
ncbi:MAG: ribonuclease HI family protein [Chloroflexota bacterium]